MGLTVSAHPATGTVDWQLAFPDGSVGVAQSRVAYVLGEILELPRPEAADALEITPALFRKRLQQAREAIVSFTRAHCGLASDAAACACNRRVAAALRIGRLRQGAADFANQPSSYAETRSLVRRFDEARRAVEVHRTSHPRASTVDFARRLVQVLDSTGRRSDSERAR